MEIGKIDRKLIWYSSLNETGKATNTTANASDPTPFPVPKPGSDAIYRPAIEPGSVSPSTDRQSNPNDLTRLDLDFETASPGRSLVDERVWNRRGFHFSRSSGNSSRFNRHFPRHFAEFVGNPPGFLVTANIESSEGGWAVSILTRGYLYSSPDREILELATIPYNKISEISKRPCGRPLRHETRFDHSYKKTQITQMAVFPQVIPTDTCSMFDSMCRPTIKIPKFNFSCRNSESFSPISTELNLDRHWTIGRSALVTAKSRLMSTPSTNR